MSLCRCVKGFASDGGGLRSKVEPDHPVASSIPAASMASEPGLDGVLTTPAISRSTRSRPRRAHREYFDRAAYRRQHKVENIWAKLKEWRVLATRYHKTVATFMGTFYLATAFQWLS